MRGKQDLYSWVARAMKTWSVYWGILPTSLAYLHLVLAEAGEVTGSTGFAWDVQAVLVSRRGRQLKGIFL